MFKLFKDSIIYVLCPSDLITGGPESLHQLTGKLKKMGHNSKIVYDPDRNSPVPHPYKQYDVDIAKEIEDNPKNLLIVPEIWPNKLNQYKRIQKAIWWLSYNFAPVHKTIFHESYKVQKLYSMLKRKFWWWNFEDFFKQFNKLIFDFKKEANRDIVHFAGSAYLYSFLLQNKAQYNLILSSGSVSQAFLPNKNNKSRDKDRKDWVLYNPKKGKEIIQALIKRTPDIKWIPIQNMSPQEVAGLMRQSKVYVDFGPFPGKERLPREAVLSKCCVIVGKRGSAKFFQDCAILDEYKFSTYPLNYTKVIQKIRTCLISYEQEIVNFNFFYRMLLKETDVFYAQIEQIFNR